MSAPVRVAFVDDDASVRDSTRLVLAGKGFDVTTFDRAAALLETLDAGNEPQCIVSDVRMPGMTGLELQAELARRHVAVPLVLVTGHGDVAMAVTALKAGASDFLEKPFDADLLAASIRDAVERSAAKEQQVRAARDVAERAQQLSARQREVMLLVAEGYSNKQIAAKLDISTRTVETYRLWVMEKMGAGSVAALVRMVLLLPPDGKA